MKHATRPWRRELPLLALLALAFALLLLRIKSPATPYDEGLVLLNAERIRHGEIPYRDFWTLYAPGYYYALAALFSVVDPTILAARWLDVVLRLGLVVAVFLLARRLTSRRVALVPAAFVTHWLATIGAYSYPVFPATAAILATTLAFARSLEARRPRWLFVTGLGLGVTAILRLDFGGYAAAGVGAAVVLAGWRDGAGQGLPPRARLRRIARDVGLLSGAALLASLPLYGSLIRVAGFATLFDQLVLFPTTVFRAVRHLPLPSPIPELGTATGVVWGQWLRLHLPLAIHLAALGMALRWLTLPMPSTDERLRAAPLFIALSGTGLGLWIKATSRFHELHALPTMICAAIVATALLYRLPRGVWRRPLSALALTGSIGLLLAEPYVLHFARLAAHPPTSPLACYSELPRAGCVRLPREQARMIEYVQARTQPGEPVFFGNARHDLIFINDLLAYFLADRPSPTRYAELHPGLATGLPVQQAIVDDLSRKQVRWVVTRRGWESREPNQSGVSSGVTTLDDYIRTHYRLEASFGPYQAWQRWR